MIRQIRYFQSVVRNNSFSEAAAECHISQSAISQQIQALERELGFFRISFTYKNIPKVKLIPVRAFFIINAERTKEKGGIL